MRRIVIVLACCSVIACGPGKMPATPGWTQTNGADEVVLSNRASADEPEFRLACTKTGPALTLSATMAQVGIANMAPPFALSLSGASFPATLVPAAADATIFSATAPLSPEVLAALRDATTARISVNDGYAFAESDVDPGQAFETFAADCAALTGVAAGP